MPLFKTGNNDNQSAIFCATTRGRHVEELSTPTHGDFKKWQLLLWLESLPPPSTEFRYFQFIICCLYLKYC